jgi:Protein kinase domain
MKEDQLVKYLPKLGDRLYLLHHAKRKAEPANESDESASKKRGKLLNKLRNKLEDLDAATAVSTEIGQSKRQTKFNSNAASETRLIKVGWYMYEKGTYKQVRARRGGGTRDVIAGKLWTKQDILDAGKLKFFPEGKSARHGNVEDFMFDVMNYQEAFLDDSITVAQLYESSGLHLLHFYITTKPHAALHSESQTKKPADATLPSVSLANQEIQGTTASSSAAAIAGNSVIALPGSQSDLNETIPYATEAIHSVLKINIGEVTINKDEMLGRGAFGVVFKGVWLGTPVAVKQITVRKKKGQISHLQHEVKKEVELNGIVRHPYIVQCLAYAVEEPIVYIMSELVVGHNLDDIIFDANCTMSLTDAEKHTVAKQILMALAYLHGLKPPMVHQDVKPANVLIDSRTRVAKLCDFGLGRLRELHQMSASYAMGVVGTPVYMAPEILLMMKKGREPSDMWSLGCTLVEMFAEQMAWLQVHILI